jgi:uncharacterized membrane protein YkvA (DUF1232 family)
MGAPTSTRLGLARTVLSEARLAVRLLREPSVPGLLKLIPVVTAGYLIWPLDIVPDLLPIVGQLDDIGVVVAGLQAFIHLCPDAVRAFHRAALAAGRRFSRMPREQDGFIDAEFRG